MIPSWQPFYKLIEKGANYVKLAYLKSCDANKPSSLKDSVSSDHRRPQETWVPCTNMAAALMHRSNEQQLPKIDLRVNMVNRK